MVDDPSSCPDEFPSPEDQAAERKRLHDIIRKLVKWESTDESRPEAREIQKEARYEIARSVARSRGETAPRKDNPAGTLRYLNDNAPPVYDPFAGGGSIPLEAQRLGLRAIASDLNPVAVLINKALIELPPRFANRPPVNPDADPLGMTAGKGRKAERIDWRGAAGLADDIRYYGRWMRERAFERIGRLYPKAKLPGGGEATVIAWLWARTVPCPNPACGVDMPLMTTFQASKKPGNKHWIRPVVEQEARRISFVIQDTNADIPLERTVIRGGKGVVCLACDRAAPHAYIREQSKAGNMGEQMTAIVAKGNRKRLFLSPTDEHIHTALSAIPNTSSIPGQKMPTTAYLVSGRGYGITHWHQLFTQRQLVALTTFKDLVAEAIAKARADGADQRYANLLCTYLALAIGKAADSGSSYTRWQNSGDKVAGVFGRQAIPMIWDFAEANPFSDSSQNWMGQIEWISKVVERLPTNINGGQARQADASTTIHAERAPVIVTDPPYYDNISYAELSDFFYVWLRPLLRDIYPDLFAGIQAPINDEMIAAPRFQNNGAETPNERFERLMGNTLRLIRERCATEIPSSIFYAYKQHEETSQGVTSTGWDTMLSALVKAGFQIIGTLPMRTERSGRSNSLGANSLASSVVLVCRPRSDDAPLATRREFLEALKAELPPALGRMQDGNIAPVDLAQAAIGPGMAIYTRYAKALDSAGGAVSVREALALINQTLDETLAEQEGDFDAGTRWALAWFEQSGFAQGEFGVAETLSKAKNTSVSGMVEAGILEASAGRVRLLRPSELPGDWDPERKRGFTTWEAAHHLVRVLDQGEAVAAKMMAKLGAGAGTARELAYRLYRICDQKNRSQEAQSYNALVQSWPEIARLAQQVAGSRQTPLIAESGDA